MDCDIPLMHVFEFEPENPLLILSQKGRQFITKRLKVASDSNYQNGKQNKMSIFGLIFSGAMYVKVIGAKQGLISFTLSRFSIFVSFLTFLISIHL